MVQRFFENESHGWDSFPLPEGWMPVTCSLKRAAGLAIADGTLWKTITAVNRMHRLIAIDEFQH